MDTMDRSRQKTGLMVGIVGILINGLIFVLELSSGIITGSTTLLADAFHNSVDMISSVVTVINFLVVGKPANSKHPFGFGRVEYLCSLFVGMIILGIGLFFLYSSFGKVLHPACVHFSYIALIFMLISIPLKMLCCVVNHKYAQKVESQTLKAASLDALGDVLVLTIATFSILLTKITDITVDGLFGIIVSGFILFSGFLVAKRATESLIGKEPEPNIIEMINSTLSQVKYVLGIHDLMIHDYGAGKVIASVHVEIPSHVSLIKAHEAMVQAELDMRKRGIDMVIHIDPVVILYDEYSTENAG